MSKFHRVVLFGGFAFHRFFSLSVFIKAAIKYICYFVSHNLVAIVLRINSVLVLVLVLAC